MTKRKYTKGPWQIAPYQYDLSCVRIENHKPSSFVMVMNQAASNDSQCELRANAHLIAAAPDLLEALDTLVDAITAEIVLSYPGLVDPCLKAASVIGKAEGRGE